jgi:hypothetical protein
MKRWVYVTLCTLAWLVPLAIAAVQAPVPEPILVFFGMQVVALLTYPAGVVGILIAMSAIFFGIATPIESLVFFSPVSFAIGYLQWFVVVPRLFGATRAPPPAQKRADDR